MVERAELVLTEHVRMLVAFGGDVDDEYLFSGMMWADEQWLFSDDTEKLVYFRLSLLKERILPRNHRFNPPVRIGHKFIDEGVPGC